MRVSVHAHIMLPAAQTTVLLMSMAPRACEIFTKESPQCGPGASRSTHFTKSSSPMHHYRITRDLSRCSGASRSAYTLSRSPAYPFAGQTHE